MSAVAIFKPSRRFRGVPLHLLGSHRILERWAVSIGDGSTDMAWQEIARTKIPPLDEQAAIVVDQLVCRAPRTTRKVVELWYRRPDPVTAIAQALRMDRDFAVYRWHTSLEYFQPLFETSPLTAIRRLAMVNTAEA